MALRPGSCFAALTLTPPADPAVTAPGASEAPMTEDLTRA